MKMEWNKVTWYSKIVALALFVALPFIGFYYGIQYGKFIGMSSPVINGGDEYYKNVAEWQTSRDDAVGFSIAYPIDFDAQGGYAMTPSEDWRSGANGTPGITSFTLIIPRAFEPQTNFIEAKLTVGESKNGAAIKNCLAADVSGENAIPTSTAMINDIPFTVFRSNGAGAGNYYEMVSYRTLHAGQCYTVEYMIHSSQILNYPESYNLHAFDRARVTDLLNRIVSTFRFL